MFDLGRADPVGERAERTMRGQYAEWLARARIAVGAGLNDDFRALCGQLADQLTIPLYAVPSTIKPNTMRYQANTTKV